jgi:antirestriction protein
MTTTLEEVQELHDAFDNGDAIAAFWDNSPEYNATLEPEEVLEAFYEAYSGQWDNDRDFAQNMAEETGFEAAEEWPARCIDWDYAARELMFDYWESGGHYFRNI